MVMLSSNSRSNFCTVVAALLLALVAAVSANRIILNSTDPTRFAAYLLNNHLDSGLPLSYHVPSSYFPSIPVNLRPQNAKAPIYVAACNNEIVSVEQQNAYEFQTEQFLATLGLNLYDGAVWELALSKLGYLSQVQSYENNVIMQHRTLQFASIKASAPCNGVMYWGQCSDPLEIGACGFCYGDGAVKTLSDQYAYFFRMVSDYWSLEGTLDARCPQLGHTWKWNDYRPVLGENAWANLIAPFQVAYMSANGNIQQISDDSNAMQLAMNFIPALEKMLVPATGGVYYAPRNTWDAVNPNIGSTISTENQASLLAGLKMLLYVLQERQASSRYANFIPIIESLVQGVTNYLLNSYSPALGFFRQGGTYDPFTNTFTWVDDLDMFAVDCQTWVITVLGSQSIDNRWGAGTTVGVWSTTKSLGGYKYNPDTNRVEGVGFSLNVEDQVFSGEWTLGAMNMLRLLASEIPSKSTEFLEEAALMRHHINAQLTTKGTLGSVNADGVLYAQKRYYIPFGWWANPLWSTASTGWTVLYDSNFNPFYLGGAYSSQYP